MSVWSHITGIMRIDSSKTRKDPDWDKLFISCNYKSGYNPKCNMPCGSEGSLQYKVTAIKDEEETVLNKEYVICFYGDLRDYDSNKLKEITKWWNRINTFFIKRYCIRQATLQIIFEDSPKIINFNTSWNEQKRNDTMPVKFHLSSLINKMKVNNFVFQEHNRKIYFPNKDGILEIVGNSISSPYAVLDALEKVYGITKETYVNDNGYTKIDWRRIKEIYNEKLIK